MKAIYICALFGSLVFGTSAINYKEDYFDQRIDHFNFEAFRSGTYKQRYLFNDTWWDRGVGPIFFYAGNEGDIKGLWDGNGFVLRAAKTFKALVVFAEHRYYGKSLPFGNDSFSLEHVGLLSVEQALADYAFLITSLKSKLGAQKCPVVAFGGSYGGVLSAYMRFKYPNIVVGSIAASAPLYQLSGLTPGELFFQAVTKDFQSVSTQCVQQVRSGFAKVQEWAAKGKAGLEKISQAFNVCKPLRNKDDYEHLLLWARYAFVTAAMMDFPYPIPGSLPAFPVKVMCERLLSSAQPEVGLRNAAALLYNASGSVSCFDIQQEYVPCADPTGCGTGFDNKAWDYQACTEINLEGSTTGQLDMFPVLTFNASLRDEYCLKTWKVLPRRDWLKTVFWGKDILSATNVVFSNGDLDPWAQGGVLQNLSDSLVAVLVKGGAHHLDLRDDNPKDPPSVRAARNFEIENIRKWLLQYYSNAS